MLYVEILDRDGLWNRIYKYFGVPAVPFQLLSETLKKGRWRLVEEDESDEPDGPDTVSCDTWDADVDALIGKLGTANKAHNELAERFRQYALAAETFAVECRLALNAMLAADKTGDAQDLVERVIEAEVKLRDVVRKGEIGKLGAAYDALHKDA